MYFFWSKTVGFFAVPSNGIILAIVAGLLFWRFRPGHLGRRIAVLGIMLLLLASVTPLGTALLLPLENRFPQWRAGQETPDGIVVLGGVLNSYISNRRNDISFGPAAERLLAAVELNRRYPAAHIVFCGGSPSLFGGPSEADVAAQFLERFGVPSDRMLLDRTSRNTMENAINAKQLATPKPGERWLLITSASHMPRAIGLFRAAGFPVKAYPVDWKTGGWRDVITLPGSMLGGLSHLDIAVHEWEGLLVDWITGRTPTLLPGPKEEISAR
jgi:uncharacterized SAM-binding protein YcdF (DUF218 family)